jgi:cation:H+ antiporter
MLINIITFLISLFIVIKGADNAIKYSTKIANHLRISPYLIGFIIVAFFSILPEAFISITSAIENNHSFGLGTIYGSNIADLTLIIAIVSLLSKHDLKIKSQIIKDGFSYITLITIPIILGLNGYYSRIDGVILILACFLFYNAILRNNKNQYSDVEIRERINYKNFLFLILSIVILAIGAHLTIKSGVNLAENLKINPIIISMFLVGLGTTIPELSFSIRATRKNHDSLALGDILGTVIVDATLVIGIMAIINPFYFNPRIVYITGVLMVLAMILIFHFMKTERIITKKEALLLILFYITFIFVEFFTNSL